MNVFLIILIIVYTRIYYDLIGAVISVAIIPALFFISGALISGAAFLVAVFSDAIFSTLKFPTAVDFARLIPVNTIV